MKKNNMTKTLLLLVIALGMNASALLAQNVGVNTDTPKATLDVQADATNANALDGIIAPRLTAEQLNAKTYTAEQTGAMVYVTAALPAGVTATAQLADVNGPGQYLFNGTKWVQSAGKDGAEWVYDETTKQLNLMRSSTAPFDNKVYYDTETGGFFDYQDSIIDGFDNAKKVFTRDTLDLKGIKYYRQGNSTSVEGIVYHQGNSRRKSLHSEQMYVDESTAYSESFNVYGGVFGLTTSRSNAAPTNMLSGFNMSARKFDGQRTTYMWGLGASVSAYAGDVPGYITAFRNDIYLNTPGTVNLATGTHNFIGVAPNSGTIKNLIGELYGLRFYGNSTHEYVEGVRVKPYLMNESNPAITNLVGFRYGGVYVYPTGAGTINNEIGLMINDVDKGIKSNYAIYTNAGKNSLGDTLQVRNINATTSTAAADKVVVADAEGVLKTKDAATLMAEAGEWKNGTNTAGNNFIYANQAKVAGNDVVITDEGKLGIGAVPSSDELMLQSADGFASLNISSSVTDNEGGAIKFSRDGVKRWQVGITRNSLDNSDGSRTGSDFAIYRAQDNGISMSPALLCGQRKTNFLGVNTLNPEAQLHVNSFANTDSRAVLRLDNYDGEIFRVNAAGKVGIGTDTPDEKLHVKGTIKATRINFTGLPTFANDANAAAGGLVAGDCYKTSTGELRIKL